jgi:hypothetical protein
VTLQGVIANESTTEEGADSNSFFVLHHADVTSTTYVATVNGSLQEAQGVGFEAAGDFPETIPSPAAFAVWRTAEKASGAALSLDLSVGAAGGVDGGSKTVRASWRW